MKNSKNFNFLYLSIGILLISILLISLLNYIDLFSSKLSNILIYVIFFSLLSLNSYKIALKSKNKGIIIGAKIASLITFLIIIIKLILKIKFNLASLIYIFLIYLFSIIPAIYGVNKKGSNH